MSSGDELTRQRNERFLGLLQPIYADCQRWAYSLTRDRAVAEDVLSQGLLVGLENIHQLKNDGAFKTWMFRILRNTHLLKIRSEKREATTVDPEGLVGIPNRGEGLDKQDERSQIVSQALAQLSDEQGQALALFEMEQLSIREVAQVLGKTESAVRVLLHRARIRFKEAFVKIEGSERLF